MSNLPPLEPASHSFYSRRLKLHYVDWGNPGAPPLILVHGGTDHCRSWDWVAARLRDRYHIIAPDLRGHGDSAWSPDGDYTMWSYVYDFAVFLDHLALGPVRIVGHSYGGNIATRYAGLYPNKVVRLAGIEGLGSSPKLRAEQAATPVDQRLRDWIAYQAALEARRPRLYASIDEAAARMQQAHPQLRPDQARHLTQYAVRQNDDGTWSWKFDNYFRSRPRVDITDDELHQLWARIACPTLLIYGKDSWASNPAVDGRADHFINARVSMYENAGHWVHHDQFDRFVDEIEQFLQD